MNPSLRSLALALMFSVPFISSAQGLPDEMYFSPDGRTLFTGGRPSAGFYDQSLVRNISLNFSQSNYWTLLTNNYSSHTDLMATMTVDGVTYDSVGVRFKGQTSYSQVSGQKKSFNITTDFLIPGQDIMGYNITNLNNCFQDPSFLREVFYQNQIRNHIPAAKSSFVKLYINGANWGLYPNVQQLNKDYLKEWFFNNDGSNWRADRPSGGMGGGWGDGTAALNFLTTDTTTYQQYYMLKSSSKVHPWDDLVTTCQVLDTTPLTNLEATLSDYMDLDRTLWFLGSEILFSDDDSYVYKGKMDYYCYFDIVTNRMVPLEYDGNSSMESSFVNWSPFYHETNANYPLLNRLLAVPELRQRYLAHFRTLLNEEMDTTSAFQLLDNYKTQIDTMVFNDPKKIYTYSNFTTEVAALKTFIRNRRTYLLSNVEVNRVSPQISNVEYYTNHNIWTVPTATETVNVTATVSSANGVDHISLYYASGLAGKFLKTQMYDDGTHDDGIAGDGIYGGMIPAQSSGQWVRYYIEAVAADAAKTVSYSPAGAEHNIYVYQVVPSVAANINVTINEVMASNSVTALDSAGEYDDWIELYNLTGQPQDLSGYFLTDNNLNLTKYEIPAGTIIGPNDYLIIWADEDGSQAGLHANFKLSSGGEHILLLNPGLEIVDDLTFTTQQTDLGYARVPNGTGSFVIQAPTFGYNNNLGTAVDEVMDNRSVTVYPNPANDKLRVVFSALNGSTLEIYNSIGDCVMTKEAQPVNTLDISHLTSGIYFVRYGNLAQKFMVSH
jgi:hypothetical protein